MLPVAEALAADGHTVEVPLLPGHGTSVEDMTKTTWDDWSSHVEAAYQDLASRTERIAVTGLSMGGTLTLWLAARHPEIAAIIPINPAGRPDPESSAGVQAFIDSGAEVMDGIGSDIAAEGVVEVAYELTPLRPLMSLFDAVDELQSDLGAINQPTLLITSRQDHVVPAEVSDHIALRLGGEPERLWLEESYHVATLDHDRERIIEATRAFLAAQSG